MHPWALLLTLHVCKKTITSSAITNSDMRRVFFITVRNEWIFMINEINVLYQRSPFFYEFLYFKVLKLAYGNVLVFVPLVCA